MLSSISGLVAEYIVAIDVTRARFLADASATAPLRWLEMSATSVSNLQRCNCSCSWCPIPHTLPGTTGCPAPASARAGACTSVSQGGRDEADEVVGDAQRAVTAEAREALELVKQEIVDYIASQWDAQHLSGTAERIDAICGAMEMEVAQLPPEERATFREELGLGEESKTLFLQTAYAMLGLISFLTAGEPEVRAWTIRKDTKAVDAAGVIHSDIQRGFIRAEVVAYDAFIEAGSMAKAKDAGTVRLEGKEYVVQDGDIILFRFNV